MVRNDLAFGKEERESEKGTAAHDETGRISTK
jgi:hypothetical protein